MDRLDAMQVFVAAVEEGSLAAAGRRLRRSPAAVSRAIAALEAQLGTQLLHRTTRALRLSDAGALYAATCRRVLAELQEAERIAGGEKSAARGMLTLTAPVVAGEEILRPVLDDFLERHPAISARVLFLDRPVSLVEEGIDVAMRIAELADSSLTAVRVGEVRRVLVASPDYLAGAPPVTAPVDLAAHRIIGLAHWGEDRWVFPPGGGAKAPRVVRFQPRILSNSVRAALASAVAGQGIAQLLSYQVAAHVQAGRLVLVLPEADPTIMPVHLIAPEGRLATPKVRAFVDFAVPRLRAEFARRRLA